MEWTALRTFLHGSPQGYKLLGDSPPEFRQISRHSVIHSVFNMTPKEEVQWGQVGRPGRELWLLAQGHNPVGEKHLEPGSDITSPVSWSSVLQPVLPWYSPLPLLAIPCSQLWDNLVVYYVQVRLSIQVTYNEYGSYEMVIPTHHCKYCDFSSICRHIKCEVGRRVPLGSVHACVPRVYLPIHVEGSFIQYENVCQKSVAERLLVEPLAVLQSSC